MTVIANDFVPVKPYSTHMVTLGVGQRADVIVEAKMRADAAVWMRSDISATCSVANQPHALAAVYYERADQSKAPESVAMKYDDTRCGNVGFSPFSLLFWEGWNGARGLIII